MVHFFFYGTLMRDQSRHHLIPRPPLWIHPAQTRGRLLHIRGKYPGLVEGEGTVFGELLAFQDEEESALLQALDAYEGYQGPGRSGNLYERRRAPVLDETAAQTVEAWLYIYVGSGNWPIIPDGRWRKTN
jgi:gamma-glutamylcyclotransferase (GGCT)/AIG2-like uncharacterized protein YtfP